MLKVNIPEKEDMLVFRNESTKELVTVFKNGRVATKEISYPSIDAFLKATGIEYSDSNLVVIDCNNKSAGTLADYIITDETSDEKDTAAETDTQAADTEESAGETDTQAEETDTQAVEAEEKQLTQKSQQRKLQI